jgi:hypothetical protein
MELAAHRGLATMNSAETNPKERGLGKPCAGKPPARFDEGEGSVPGDRLAALSTLHHTLASFTCEFFGLGAPAGFPPVDRFEDALQM